MVLFRDDKEREKILGEIKEYAETLHKLSDEVKMLRKEVEFLTSLSKRNEENILKDTKKIYEIDEKFRHLLRILELDERDLQSR